MAFVGNELRRSHRGAVTNRHGRHEASGHSSWTVASRRHAARFALVAFVISLPLSISGMEIALGVLLALAGLAAISGERWPGRSPVDRPLFLFVASLGVSTLVAGPAWSALDAYRGLWVAGTYIAVRMLAGGAEHATRLAGILVLTAAAVAIYGIVQHFTGIDVYRTLAGRPTEVDAYAHDPNRYVVVGFFPSYLTYAHSLMLPLGWATAATVGASRWILDRWVAAASTLLILVALMLSSARGAWVAAGAVVVCASCLGNRRWRFPVAAVAATLALVVFSLSPGLRARARTIVDIDANTGRLAIWAANLEAVRDHPLLGVGFGNYDRRMESYYARHRLADRRSHAHNSFLQIAAEAGIVGLSAFCLLFGSVLVCGWKLLRRLGRDHRLWVTAAGAWLGIIGFLVGSCTQDTFADSECAMPMWFAVAVLMIIDRDVAADGKAPPCAS